MAIGLGIHGEPGIDETDNPTADGLAELLVSRLLDEVPEGVEVAGARVVPILNGLGSLKYEEMFVIYRRIAELLRDAASVVADEAGLSVATVTTAQEISPAQLDRLAKSLAGSYGRELRINHVIDPSIVGGIRVQLGDEVIDGTVATRINELRLQLAS